MLNRLHIGLLFVAGFLSFTYSNAIAQLLSRDTVDAGTTTITLAPLWRDHYDLSLIAFNAAADPHFAPLMQQLRPRSWRCSVGRWEIATIPVPLNSTSHDTSVLKTIEREYYRGSNTLAAADDPVNYHFAYIDTLLAATLRTGAEPYLCFDYMPFTLSAQKNPNNPFNLDTNILYSFSNGIRTAKPADPAVYARVVRNVVRHVRGQFAGTRDFGINYIEIGNEPEIPYFFTGSAPEFYTMYRTVAAELAATPAISNIIKLGCGSFAFMDTTFASTVLQNIHSDNVRTDFVSYHSYSDSVIDHYVRMYLIRRMVDAYVPGAEIVNGEWGRELGGADPVYGTVVHGLFRAKVMLLMQLFGIKIAHESLFMSPGLDEIGLLTLNPVGTKPASDVYLGLNRMNDCLLALDTKVTNGDYLYAGKNSSNSKVCIMYIGDDPGASATRTVQLLVNNLPWGNNGYAAQRSIVSDSTWAARLGVALEKTRTLTGNTFSDTITYGPGPGKGRLIIWELSQTQAITRLDLNISGQNTAVVIHRAGLTEQVNISYKVQSDTPVNISIYDHMGASINTLVHGLQPAGEHTILWNASHVSSGVYVCRVQIGGIVVCKKMVVVK